MASIAKNKCMQFNNVFGHNIIYFKTLAITGNEFLTENGGEQKSLRERITMHTMWLCAHRDIGRLDVAQVLPQRGNADDWDSVVSLKQQPYWSLVRRVLELLIVFLLLKLFAWSVMSWKGSRSKDDKLLRDAVIAIASSPLSSRRV